MLYTFLSSEFIDTASVTFKISSHKITESSTVLFKYAPILQVLGFQA